MQTEVRIVAKGHSFGRCLVSTCSIPGAILPYGDIRVKWKTSRFTLMELPLEDGAKPGCVEKLKMEACIQVCENPVPLPCVAGRKLLLLLLLPSFSFFCLICSDVLPYT